MSEQEFRDLFKLLCKYEPLIEEDNFELKNDLTFLKLNVRNKALQCYDIFLEEEKEPKQSNLTEEEQLELASLCHDIAKDNKRLNELIRKEAGN